MLLNSTRSTALRRILQTHPSIRQPLIGRMSSTFHHAPTPAEEDAIFEAEVKKVEEWWASPRYKGIKRTYSARDVVSKRGTLPQTYPSSHQAKKLFALLTERANEGQPVHTSR